MPRWTDPTAPVARRTSIVCGLHDVGMRVVEQLRIAGEQVVIVDDAPDPRLLRICDEFGAVTSPEQRAPLHPPSRPPGWPARPR